MQTDEATRSFSTDMVLIVKWQQAVLSLWRKHSHSIPIRLLAVYHAAGRVKPLSLSLTRLRLRGAEKASLIEVEKQPVFVCS